MQQQVPAQPEAASVLVFGAGAVAGPQGLGDGPAASGGRLVVFEPDPDLAAELEARLAGRGDIRVLPFALGTATGEAELRVFNLPGMASLHAPTGLKALFPGLRELRRVRVRTVAAAEALATLPDLPDPLHVHIDAPGSEEAILAGLAAAGLLARTARLDLRCGREALFEGAPDLGAIQARLLGEGLVPAGTDLSDPDLPRATFVQGDFPRLRAVQAELAEVQARLAEAEAARVEAVAAAEALRGALSAREAEFKALSDRAEWRRRRIAELEAAGRAEDEAARARAAELAEVQGRLAAAEQALRAAEDRAAGLSDRLAAREAELTAAVEKAEERARRIAELEAEARKAADVADAAARRQTELEHRLGLLQADLRRAEGQIEILKDLLLRGESL